MSTTVALASPQSAAQMKRTTSTNGHLLRQPHRHMASMSRTSCRVRSRALLPVRLHSWEEPIAPIRPSAIRYIAIHQPDFSHAAPVSQCRAASKPPGKLAARPVQPIHQPVVSAAAKVLSSVSIPRLAKMPMPMSATSTLPLVTDSISLTLMV